MSLSLCLSAGTWSSTQLDVDKIATKSGILLVCVFSFVGHRKSLCLHLGQTESFVGVLVAILLGLLGELLAGPADAHAEGYQGEGTGHQVDGYHPAVGLRKTVPSRLEEAGQEEARGGALGDARDDAWAEKLHKHGHVGEQLYPCV